MSTTELTAPTTDVAMAPGFTSAQSWDLAQRIGKAFAASSLVPQTYQGNLANCIVALEMAHRMGASPLMVMQNLYIVHGNPGWSSKFLVACFNQSGRFSSLRYEWNEARTACRAWAVEKATDERIDGPLVTLDMAKAEGWSTKNGSKWKTMPELMLMYRAAAFLIRTYAPEISMGLHSDDELRDMAPAEQPKTTTLANLIGGAPMTAEPIDMSEMTTIDAETGEVSEPPAPSNVEAKPEAKPAKDKSTGPSFAVLHDQIKAAKNAEAAALVLDRGRDLPADQKADLSAYFAERFPNA